MPETSSITLFNSHETTENIRCAIRNKLKELDSQDDDALIEYIMIMILNKKSERRMADDLKQFLFSNAGRFSSWLVNYTKNFRDDGSKFNHKHHHPHHHHQNEQSLELAIQIDSNEFNEEDDVPRSNNGVNEKRNQEAKMREQLIEHRKGHRSSHSKPSTILSRVGAVIKHTGSKYTNYSDDNDEDEDDTGKYNPSKPMLSSSSTSSVIRVPERKYSVPKSHQPNKSIFLKAIGEANNSTTTTQKRHERVREQEQPSTARQSVKARLGGGSSVKSRLGANRDADDEMDYRESNRQRRIELNDDEEDDDDGKHPSNVNTRFIVTLKGVDEREILSNNSNNTMDASAEADNNKYSLKRRHSNDDNDDDVEMNEDEGYDDENSPSKRIKIRCAYWPSCEKADNCPYLHPNKSCEAFPKCPFGLKCHYIHPYCRYDGHCTRTDCPYTHLSKNTPVSVLSNSFAMAPVTPVSKPNFFVPKSAPPLAAAKKNLYRLNKPSVLSTAKYAVNHKASVDPTKKDIECKFGVACKNVKCAYAHPKLPAKSALKWNASQMATSSELATVE